MSLSSIKRTAPVLGVAMLAALFAVDASAATSTIADLGTSWKVQITGILGIAKLILGMIGFFMFAGGLFYFYKDNKQPGQGHVKTGIIALFVGTGLMIIPWLLGMFVETVATGEGAKATTATTGKTY